MCRIPTGRLFGASNRWEIRDGGLRTGRGTEREMPGQPGKTGAF